MSHSLKKTTIKSGKNSVGATVRRLRRSQRVPVSQQDLAGRLAALGVSLDRSAVARIESGDRYVLDYEAVALAKALRIPIEALFPR